MALTVTNDINEISDLYVMYNELCSLNFNAKNYKKVLKYFPKLSKYFNLLYALVSKDTSIRPEHLEGLKKGFSEIKELAKHSAKECGEKPLGEVDSGNFDKYEKIFINEKNKELAYNKISQMLFDDGIYVSALSFYKKFMRYNPDNFSNYKILGILYHKTNDIKKAILCYEKYNQYNPGEAQIYNAIGALYSELDRFGYFEERISNFKKALAIDPNCEEAIRNLAYSYRNADMPVEAMEYFNKLVSLNPTNDDYFNFGYERLKFKDFEEGFKYFSYRFDRGEYSILHPRLRQPELTKGIDVKDKVVLVNYEQGFGDSIQFCRYIHQLNAKKIILRVQDGLVELLKKNFPNIEVVGKSTSIISLKFDYYIMLLNLIPFLGATPENIPLSSGYIKADDEKIKYYKENFFNNNCIKIGITWHGAKNGTKHRNIPLSYFYPLSKIKNVKLYSFQKELNEDLSELPEGVELVDLGKTFNDFADTAAAMTNVDLFISTDNGVANLAGSMGIKTYLMLFEDSDWRWFLDQEKTPWYDNFRLFYAKNKHDDIEKLIRNIEKELKANFKID